jgi:hypothetical protein
MGEMRWTVPYLPFFVLSDAFSILGPKQRLTALEKRAVQVWLR